MDKIKLSHIVPILPTENIDQTIDFYVQVLGFKNDWSWEENSMVRLKRESVTLIFERNPSAAKKVRGLDFMVFLNGINAFYAEVQKSKLTLSDKLEDKPWGLREFSIQDNNGIFLRFAESLEMLPNE